MNGFLVFRFGVQEAVIQRNSETGQALTFICRDLVSRGKNSFKNDNVGELQVISESDVTLLNLGVK